MERRELLEEVLDCLADATHRGELREDGGVPGSGMQCRGSVLMVS